MSVLNTFQSQSYLGCGGPGQSIGSPRGCTRDKVLVALTSLEYDETPPEILGAVTAAMGVEANTSNKRIITLRFNQQSPPFSFFRPKMVRVVKKGQNL